MPDPKQSYKEKCLEQFEEQFKDSFTYGAMETWEDGLAVKDFISKALDNQIKEVMDYTREQLDYAISRAAGNYDGEAGGAVDAYQDIINFLNKLG